MNLLTKLIDWFIRALEWLWHLFFPEAHHPPNASFTATPAAGTVLLVVTCDASASSDPDGTIASYTWDFGDGQHGTGVTITHTYTTMGTYTIQLTVTDNEGATSSTSKTIVAQQANQPPVASFTFTPTTGKAPLVVTYDASTSSDPDGTIVSYTWGFGDGQSSSGVNVTHVYVSAGSYIVKLTVTDNEGASSSANQNLSVSGIVLPPDPATIAPELDKTVATPLMTATDFLYTGSHPIQTGVAPGTIELKRAAVLRGKVTDRGGTPLPAVTIAVLQHPEFGSTLSRSDGMFDMAVNGGGLLTITYTKEGYLRVQRQVQVPWQDYTWLNEVVLIPLDSKVTAIDLASTASLQVARGSTVSDADGTRQATLLFSQGTAADMALPDGTIQHLQQLSVHITEYTVGDKGPQAMPALLPPTSAYTYAFELNADEELASGATTVRFSPPLFYYVENFLNFPVGTLVPVGYFDREKATWIPSKNGRVIKILSITKGLADLDTDGHNTADNGAALGITDAERQQLAALYQPNQSLWRVPITHLSQPWDPNMSIGFPLDACASNLKPKGDNLPDYTCPVQGSIIESQNQTLGEVMGITGTTFQLHYQSDRVLGRRSIYSLQIPLSGSSIPASLKGIELEVDVAGRHFAQSFPAMPNQNYTFVWDGKDAYGRLLQGRYSATVRVGYTYQGVYGVQPSDRPGYGSVDINLFAHFSYYGIPATVNLTRQEVTLWQEWQIFIGAWDQRYQGLGSWSLNIHHVYHPIERKLYMGNGKRRGSAAIASCITTVAGVGTEGFSGDGGPATQAQLYSPWGIAIGADGSLYFADTNNYRIRRVGTDGIISTIAGNGSSGFSGDGGPATQAQLNAPEGIAIGPDGSLYFADQGNSRIRRVGTDGIISTVAGNGIFGLVGGDGGPATQAQIARPPEIAIGPDGSLYMASPSTCSIRRVGTDGIISTVAGVGRSGFGGDGGPATQALLTDPVGIAIGPDGSLYIADQDRIRRVGPDGIISTVVGNGSRGLSGDGGPATQAQLLLPRGIATGPDSSLYISSMHDLRIRRVGPDGIIDTVAGNGTSPTGGLRGDGGPATQAQFSIPMGIAIGPDGSLYIADAAPGYSGIRQVSRIFPGLYLNDLFIPAEDGSEIYVFNNMGRHFRTLDALTGAVRYQFTYDTANHLVEVKDGDGNVTSIEHDAGGNPTAIVSPFGQRTSLTLDANGYLACITNPANESMQFTYTSDGLLTDMTDPLGHVHRFSYDALGRLLRDENPAGGKVDLLRTELDNGYSVKSISALLREQTYVVKLLPGGEEQYVNSCCGGLETKSEKHSDGTSTTTFPDGTEIMQMLGPDPRWGMLGPLSKQLEMKTPGGLKLTGSSQRAVKMTDPLSLTDLTDIVTLNGQAYTSTYTAATSSLVSTTPTGRKVTTTLDGEGRTVQRQVAGLLPMSYSYDVHGRLHTITQGTGTNARKVMLDYTATSNLERVTDPLGQATKFVYDAAGRVKTQTLADGRVIGYNYDANSNLTALTPPGGKTHTFTYTPEGRVSTYTAPAVGGQNAQTQYTYDADRHLTHVTRPDGQIVDLGYNGTGQLSSLTTPRGQVSYTYDAATGMISTITAPGGLTLKYSYDGALLLGEGWSGAVTGSVSRTYDNSFRVTARSVNSGNSISYQYDNDGLLTQAGNLIMSRDPQNGLLTGTTIGIITDTWSYNGFGEPLSYSAAASGTTFYAVQYTRDILGRITQQDETIHGVIATRNYSYDLAGRLTGIATNGITTTSYTYDSNGNRLSATDAGGTVNGSYDAQDRLTQYGSTTYTYTANGELQTKTAGSLTTKYEYDMLGNLMTVTLPNNTQISYLVDGLNRRIGKQVNGTLVQGFVYQDGLRPIAELDGSSGLVSLFVYTSRRNVPDYLVKSGTTYRIITDRRGSPRLVVNTATGQIVQRIDYDAFGNVTTDTNPGFQPFGFAGGLYDCDTGLVRFGSRDYDPETGRWITKDPIGFSAGDESLYTYVNSDPINLIDPSGLAVCLTSHQCACQRDPTSAGCTGIDPDMAGRPPETIPVDAEPPPTPKTTSTVEPPPPPEPPIMPKPSCGVMFNLCMARCSSTCGNIGSRSICAVACFSLWLTCAVVPH